MRDALYHLHNSSLLTRRSFLAATSSLAAAALWSSCATGPVRRRVAFSAYPFSLGVASGDPAPTSVVLWTRLAPDPVNGGGMPDESVEVEWQVAEDEKMSSVVQRGTTIARPDWAHSVHVEVEGLRPDHWYFYQFKASGEVSAIGKTKTTPTIDFNLNRLRFAFVSCQHYEAGHYTAYEHISRENIDLVVHLGDYIYEGGISLQPKTRQHNSPPIITLQDYRNRYALYKSDKSLQAAHATAPWIVTPDDHEVVNNYATDVSKWGSGAALMKRRAAAYKAFYEHMPMRRASLPNGAFIKLFRRVSYGRLADFHVLETRQHRTPQPCGDGNKAPCPETFNPKATLLGPAQKKWLFSNLEKSTAKWNVLAQQVMMARVDRRAGEEFFTSMDQWPGYEVERRALLEHLARTRVRNPVVLTGDIHSNWANELSANFEQPDQGIVASEFVGTSISSGGDGAEKSAAHGTLISENPFVKFQNSERGYVLCEILEDQWRTDFRTIPYVTKPGAPVVTRASYVVETGQPRLMKV